MDIEVSSGTGSAAYRKYISCFDAQSLNNVLFTLQCRARLDVFYLVLEVIL